MITSLVRQFGRAMNLTSPVTATPSTPLWRTAASLPSSSLSIRSFVTALKKKKKKEKERKLLHKSKTPKVVEAPSLQHQEWVKFQKSIAVDGFETGQTVTLQTPNKKQRTKGRRSVQQVAIEKALAERQRLTAFGGGLYPPLRYSEEETERLLKEAYAAIPPRAGKRGTRNLKRQAIRWHLVRKIRKKYKKHLAAFQIRKMKARSAKIAAVKQVLEAAPGVVQRDRDYQARVFQKWAENMTRDQQEEEEETFIVDHANGKFYSE